MDKEKAKILFDQVFDSSWFQENNYMAQEALDRYDFSDSNEDLEEALYYFEQFFAEANEYFNQKEEVTNAAYYIALHYYEGDGCKQDKKKSFYYCSFVVENSSDDVEISDISLRLGYLYYRGEGCEQNKEKAEEYFNKSVDYYYEEDSSLCDFIGDFYKDEEDYEMAIKWYSRAVDEGSEETKEKLEELKNKEK